MITGLLEKKEKKVEYVELIYDLIFVYVIGRNNLLLHNFSGGFVAPAAFFAYILCTLAVIQIWNYTTYYVNVYGRHGVRDHVYLFVNMFLMYFIGEGTGINWQPYHTQYHAAWALILVNMAAQYLLERRSHMDEPDDRKQCLRMAGILLGEAVLVLGAIAEFNMRQSSWCSLAAILASICAVFLSGQRGSNGFVDFAHLTERAMLYVVFTFGEMIIGLSGYFEGLFSLNSLYFSLMAFLIVVALFLSYGVLYDRIVDRERRTNGLVYMFLHIFIIFALNNITNALEFMQEEEVALLPKMLFLTISFLLYFAFLLAAGGLYARKERRPNRRFLLRLAGMAVLFTACMIVLREYMKVNIAISVLFVYAVFGILYRFGKAMDAPEGGRS